MKHFILFFGFLWIFTLVKQDVYAQYDDENEAIAPVYKDKKFDPKKMAIEMMCGAGFGDIIFVDVAGAFTYRVIERLQIGAGIDYQYLNFRDYYPKPFNTANTIGGRLFGRVFVFRELFAQLEYAPINADVVVIDHNNAILGKGRKTYHNVFMGGGYNFPIGGDGDSRSYYFSLSMLVNVTTNDLYPKRLPIFRVAFGIGL